MMGHVEEEGERETMDLYGPLILIYYLAVRMHIGAPF
jgi:hypothetical protein